MTSLLKCRQCGEPYSTTGRRGRPPVTCSPACQRAYRRDSSRSRVAQRRLLDLCIDCGGNEAALPGSDFCARHTADRAAVSARHAAERAARREA